MRLFGNLAIYLGLGFLMSFIINRAEIYLIVSIIMFVLGIVINTISSKRNKK